MNRISADSTVGELLADRPSRSRIFEALNIDYCCGGGLSLEEACRRRGLDTEQIVGQLEAEQNDQPGQGIEHESMALGELIDHIVRTHHEPLRRELPRLDQITSKVHRVHGGSDPRLGELREAFVTLRDEVLEHIEKEERILFPMIRELEAASELPDFHFGSLANLIRQMKAEHEASEGVIEAMHRVSDGFTPPARACNTYRAMLDGLAALARDMERHIHKENDVLFPRAFRREAELTTKGGV